MKAAIVVIFLITILAIVAAFFKLKTSTKTQDRFQHYTAGQSLPSLSPAPTTPPEVFEVITDIPFFQSNIADVSFVSSGNEHVYQFTAVDSVESITFWHLDDMEEEGWEVVEAPDTKNKKIQTFTAIFDDRTIEFEARTMLNKTLVTITQTSN